MSLFSCKDTVRLVSQSLDHDLTMSERLTMRTHLLMCPMCSRFREQLLYFHRIAGEFEEKKAERNGDGSPALPPEARARIERALETENP